MIISDEQDAINLMTMQDFELTFVCTIDTFIYILFVEFVRKIAKTPKR